MNEILVGMRRSGAESYGDDSNLERKGAITMCQDRHSWQHQRNEGRWVDYRSGSEEIDEALTAMKAWRAILRHGDIQPLDDFERKALSAFSFGNTGWVVPPQVSTRLLSCRTDPRGAVDVFAGDDLRQIDIIPN